MRDTTPSLSKHSMTSALQQLVTMPMSGVEPVHADGVPVGGTLADFWRWSVSDLMSNATRGRLAEYLVHRAVGSPESSIRAEWDAFDLTTPEGIRVEVKSAAYIQSWQQTRESPISFRVPAARGWCATTNRFEKLAKRQADVYVFAILNERIAPDPLNIRHWLFYVLPTRVLNARTRSQHSITLASLIKEAGTGVAFEDLAITIKAVAII